MTLGLRAPRGLVRMDPITIQRAALTVDSEGNGVGGLTTVLDGRGTVFALSGRDLVDAGIRKTLVDAGVAVELGTDIRTDDQVSTPRGSFVVVAIEDRRMYRRVLLRRIS